MMVSLTQPPLGNHLAPSPAASISTIKATILLMEYHYMASNRHCQWQHQFLEFPDYHNGSSFFSPLPVEPTFEAPVDLSLIQWVQNDPLQSGVNVFVHGLRFFREVTYLDGSYVSQSKARPDALTYLIARQQRGKKGL
jgi:hypothetical protein